MRFPHSREWEWSRSRIKWTKKTIERMNDERAKLERERFASSYVSNIDEQRKLGANCSNKKNDIDWERRGRSKWPNDSSRTLTTNDKKTDITSCAPHSCPFIASVAVHQFDGISRQRQPNEATSFGKWVWNFQPKNWKIFYRCSIM